MIILFLIIFLFTPSSVLANDNSHIKYFGYYWGMSGVDKTSSYVNAMFTQRPYDIINAIKEDIDQIAQYEIGYIQKLDSLHVKTIIDIATVLFYWDPGVDGLCQFHCYKLRDDYVLRWNKFWQKLSPYSSKIAAIHPVDEPQSSVATMNDYNKAIDLIGSTTDIPILAVGTADAVLRGQMESISSSIDWIGFDQYWCWNSNECPDGVSIPDKFQKIVNIARQRNIKIIIVPDAVFDPNRKENLDFNTEQQMKIPRTNMYYDLCKNEPLCIGIFPYLWEFTGRKNDPQVGANLMPDVESNLKRIGTEIINSQQIAGDYNRDRKVDLTDFAYWKSQYLQNKMTLIDFSVWKTAYLQN